MFGCVRSTVICDDPTAETLQRSSFFCSTISPLEARIWLNALPPFTDFAHGYFTESQGSSKRTIFLTCCSLLWQNGSAPRGHLPHSSDFLWQTLSNTVPLLFLNLTRHGVCNHITWRIATKFSMTARFSFLAKSLGCSLHYSNFVSTPKGTS